MKPADDRDLVRRLLAGEERAFDEFFGDAFPRLHRFALARMPDERGAAEEVAQVALSKAVTKLETYRGDAPLFTWLCTFCRHEISAYYERAGREPALAGLDDETLGPALERLASAPEAEPERVLQREELARLVHATLDLLPERYAAALEWMYLEERSVKEIAERLELSPKAAESMLTRARAAFHTAFAALTRGRRPRG